MSQNEILGTENNDFLLNTILDDQIFALSGDDQIEISSSNDLDLIDGGEGNDQLIINYSSNDEDLVFLLQNYDELNHDGSFNIDFMATGTSNFSSFYSIENLKIITGNGNDVINSNNDYFNAIVDAGGGHDLILPGRGSSIVDGGSGFDLLDLNFSDSSSGITSSLRGNKSGSYISDDSSIEFSNIEALHIIASDYDDILVAVNGKSNDRTVPFSMSSMIDGQEGFDQLVVDYSEHTEDLMFLLNDDGTGNGSLNVHFIPYVNNYSSRIDFNNIESFALSGGSGDDLIDLGYENYSDDTINTGAGDDLIIPGLGNDTVDAGDGFDVLSLDFYESETGVVSFLTDAANGQYSNGVNTIQFSNFEVLEIFGSSHDDILVGVHRDSDAEIAPYSAMNSMIDGDQGFDQLITDYSEHTEDLMFTVHNYGKTSGLIEVTSYMTDYNSRIDFNSIETLAIKTGSGNDNINLGYGNYTNDVVNAGGGDDFIVTGAGNDTIDGGMGNDTFIYELGHGVNIISDSGGANDTIIFGDGITQDNLSWDFNGSDLNFGLTNSPNDQLIIEDYLTSVDTIENFIIEGQIFDL